MVKTFIHKSLLGNGFTFQVNEAMRTERRRVICLSEICTECNYHSSSTGFIETAVLPCDWLSGIHTAHNYTLEHVPNLPIMMSSKLVHTVLASISVTSLIPCRIQSPVTPYKSLQGFDQHIQYTRRQGSYGSGAGPYGSGTVPWSPWSSGSRSRSSGRGPARSILEVVGGFQDCCGWTAPPEELLKERC